MASAPNEDAELEQIATAFFEAKVNAFLEQMRDVEFDVSEFTEFYRSLVSESDRALAVISFAYIEEKLKDLMAKEINPEITGGAKSLFQPMGPLGTVSCRIKVAAGLYWIGKATYTNLEVLRKIRNEFAHESFRSGFDNPRITGLMSGMLPVEDVVLKMIEEGSSRIARTPRLLFHVRSILTCQDMITELLTAPQAIRMALPPMTCVRSGWERIPTSMKALSVAAVGVIREVLKDA